LMRKREGGGGDALASFAEGGKSERNEKVQGPPRESYSAEIKSTFRDGRKKTETTTRPSGSEKKGRGKTVHSKDYWVEKLSEKDERGGKNLRSKRAR